MGKTNLSVKEYDTNDDVEARRLAIQADACAVFDTNVICEFLRAIKKSGKKKGDTIYVLELGGANMSGARKSRYTNDVLDYVKKLGYKLKIINAEYNADSIKEAEALFGDMFTNVNIDLNNNPSQSLTDLGKKYCDGNKFDMVFSNYVLQHLKNPTEVMVAVKTVLDKNGISMHRVPDDAIKIKGFYTNGKPNKVANDAARSIVELFVTSLPRATDRQLGSKMFDICTTGFNGQGGAGFDVVYDRIAKDVVGMTTLNERKIEYLEKDFAWYGKVLKDVSNEVAVSDPEYSKKCLSASKVCDEMYATLQQQFLKPDTSYAYGSHEIIVSNGLTIEYVSRSLSDNKSIEFINTNAVENNKW